MLRRAAARLAPASLAIAKSTLTPLEALTQIQLGITPPLSVQRGFLLEHCPAQLQHRGITEAKLVAMDGRLCTQLMKRLVLEQYLSVPFRVLSFDMEFTGPPAFTADGPTEDITEMGLYSPTRDETFSCLVRPACGRRQGPGVAELTHISDEMLERDGVPFSEAWERFLAFVGTPGPGEPAGAGERVLLLSHGGKLADVSLIKWTLEKFGLELPSNFVFGDTIHVIRDAHRRRPVTVDKHPPSWKLLDLVQWLRIPPTLPAHRAGNDAKMTWDALYHTLLRYGDDEMTPREQLVTRFFDEEAKALMRERQGLGCGGAGVPTSDRTLPGEGSFAYGSGGDDVYLAADMSSAGVAGGARGSAGTLASAPESGGDVLDLDFDDIFKDASAEAVQPAGSPAASLPVEEFRLEEVEEAVDGGAHEPPSTTGQSQKGTKVPTSTKAQSARRAKRKGSGNKSPIVEMTI